METAFELDNVSFRYNKKKPLVIDNISFKVMKGTIFGLLGPSGAGKSTTQKIMSKLLDDYQGSISYFGKDLKTFGKSFYEGIGVGFEMPVLFTKLTARENLAFFAGLYKRHTDYESILIRIGLGEAIDQQVGQYSKGMKARLNFVRALINDPDVLFLDEPTNGLDPANARIIKDIILEEKSKGKTIFLSTHLMSEVEELCDMVAFIAHGHVLEIASPKDLRLKYGKRELVVEYLDEGKSQKATFALDDIGTNPDFLRIAKTKKIITLHSSETTLDKIFIDIVGQKEKQ